MELAWSCQWSCRRKQRSCNRPPYPGRGRRGQYRNLRLCRAIPGGAVDQVSAGAAPDLVVVEAASERVIAGAAEDVVLAVAVADIIVAAQRVHRIVAAKRVDHVTIGGA